MAKSDITSDRLLSGLPTDGGAARLGHYLLTSRLGEGRMGAVYLGRDSKLLIPVAVRVLPTRLGELKPDAARRFVEEVRAAAEVKHSNLVRVYTVDEEHNLNYLVTEYVPGETADERVKREGPLPEAEALDICIAVGEALTAAHARGVIHRDVRPSNIIIRREDGQVKLADLGLAGAFGGGYPREIGRAARSQHTRMLGYLSPEQVKDEKSVDPRVDVYSLGATLCTLVTGRAPGEAALLLSASKAADGEQEGLKRLRPGLSSATIEAIERMMAEKAQDRFATIPDAVKAMKSARQALSVRSGGLAPARGAPTRVYPSGQVRAAAAGTSAASKASRAKERLLSAVRKHWKVAAIAGGFALVLVVGLALVPDEKEETPALVAQVSPAVDPESTPSVPAASVSEGPAAVEHVSAPSELPAAELHAEDPAEQARKEAEAKAAGLLMAARALREEGLLGRAEAMFAEVLVLVPDHPDARRERKEVQRELAAKRAEEEKEREEELAREADDRTWRDLIAKSASAREAYPSYLAEYPNGRHADGARRGIQRLAEARARADDRAFRLAQRTATAARRDWSRINAACKTYLGRFPEGRHSEDAKREIGRYAREDDEAFGKAEGEVAKAKDRLDLVIRAYESYLRDYARGKHARKAWGLAGRARSKLAEELEAAINEARSARERGSWSKAEAKLRSVLSRKEIPEARDLLEEGPANEIAIDLGSGVKLEMVWIPPGTFQMGSLYGAEDERPVRTVTITKGSYLGKTEVTNAQWNRIMSSAESRRPESNSVEPTTDPQQSRRPRRRGNSRVKPTPEAFLAPSHPTVGISWFDATAFAEKLSELVGATFRLPAEAEWEYASRAGSNARYFFGEGETLGSFAWYLENSEALTHPVGEKRPNPWGLYDIYGNVWEWCADWYSRKHYAKGETRDPRGPEEGTVRVIRGGSFAQSGRRGRYVSSAYRERYGPEKRSLHIGFRVALEP